MVSGQTSKAPPTTECIGTFSVDMQKIHLTLVPGLKLKFITFVNENVNKGNEWSIVPLAQTTRQSKDIEAVTDSVTPSAKEITSQKNILELQPSAHGYRFTHLLIPVTNTANCFHRR